MKTSREQNGTTPNVTFESALAELDAIVAELETGNLTLDASVDRFRKASELADACKVLITEARLRVTELQAEPIPPLTEDGAVDDVPV